MINDFVLPHFNFFKRFENMYSVKTTGIYIALVFITAICILFFSLFILSFSRENFIDFILQHLRRDYLSDILRNKIITPQKFLLIRYACFALIVFDVVFVLLMIFFRRKIIEFFSFVFNAIAAGFISVARVFNTSSKTENFIFLFLFAIIFARGLFYIITTNLQYDEIWCYNYFTSRPVYLNFFSFCTYPFYEITTHIFKWLPFSMKVNLRLPSLIFGLGVFVIIYACTKKLSAHFLTSLACAALFVALPFGACYMMLAKGVMEEIFFAAISFFSIVFFLKDVSCKKYMALFVLANIAGMYAMPTHIYYCALLFAICFVYILYFQKSVLTLFVFANILILLLSFLCYAPVFIGSGISTVSNIAFGNFTTPDPWPNIFSFIGYISLAFTGSKYLLAIALIIAAFFLFINKLKTLFFLFGFGILLFLLPFPIRILQHLYIPERSVAFINFIIPLCIFIIFFIIKKLMKEHVLCLLFIILFVSSLMISHSHFFRFWSAKQDKNAIEISELLMAHHVENCYDNAPASQFYYYYPALEYYYGRKKTTIHLTMAAQKSLRYKPFLQTDNYDCIIDSIGASDKNGYENIYNNLRENF